MSERNLHPLPPAESIKWLQYTITTNSVNIVLSHDTMIDTHNIRTKENKTEKRRAASSGAGTIAATA
jgi:hypothetical protein